jgi:hypothetical protein
VTSVALSYVSKNSKIPQKRSISLKISQFQKGKLVTFETERKGTVQEYRRLEDGWLNSTWKSSHSPSCFNPAAPSIKE